MNLLPPASPALNFGTTGPAFRRRFVTLPISQAKTHMHIIGVSGSGKSRFLAGLFISLLNKGLPATLIDPHGDLAHLVLSYLVANGAYDRETAFERVLYLDLPGAERAGRFLPFNVLNQPYDPHTVARNVLEALRRAWPALADGVAPNFENIILAGTYVLIHHQLPLTLLHDLLVDKPWRDGLLATVPDAQVVGFFHDRFDKWNKDQPALIESSLRRIFLLSFSPVLRYSLGQRTNALPYREILDMNRSVIVNLALGDSDARRLIGSLLTVSAEQAALSRAELPASARLGTHHLVIDEFSEFTAQSEEALSRMLSLTRKYGLYLVMAHQTFSQASERLQGALQNVGIEVAFRLGRADAEHAATILGRVNPLAVKHEAADSDAQERGHPVFYSLPEQWERWAQAVQDLQPREAFLKLASGPVTKFKTLSVPDPVVDAAKLAAVEARYLQTMFRAKADIEQELAGYRSAAQPPPTTRRTRRLPDE